MNKIYSTIMFELGFFVGVIKGLFLAFVLFIKKG
jgi:hypothetical protein